MTGGGPVSAVASPADVLQLLWGPDAVVTRTRSLVPRPGRTDFVLLPRASRATLLVPVRPGWVAEKTLREYGSSNTRRAKVLSGVGAPLGRLGVLGVALPRMTVTPGPGAGGLIAHAGELLGEDVVPAIQLGPIRPNRKPVVQLRAPDGRALAFMKVGINPLTRDRVAHEARALEQLREHGELDLEVPTLLHSGVLGAVNYAIIGVVSTRTDGPLSLPRAHAAMAGLASAFGVTALQLRDAAWWTTLVDDLAGLEGAEATSLQDAAQDFSREQGERPLMTGAAHGDWAPWNMATPAGRTVVWDWERFRLEVPVGWDAIHFEIERNRRAGLGPMESISSVIPVVDQVVARNGAAPEDGRAILASYLIDLGVRQLRSRSEAAKDSRGALTTWLLPALNDVLDVSRPAAHG